MLLAEVAPYRLKMRLGPVTGAVFVLVVDAGLDADERGW